MPDNTQDAMLDFQDVISPRREFVAYETVMANMRASLPVLNKEIVATNLIPSKFLQSKNTTLFDEVDTTLLDTLVSAYSRLVSIALRDDLPYPKSLKELESAPPILYYKGDLSLLTSTSVSVVGTRKPSPDGIALAKAVSEMLVRENFTLVSGLARGIDTVAIETALEAHGSVIACIGTPIVKAYPPENAALQNGVATRGLVISHVPILRYEREPFAAKRFHFPERNEIMAAVSKATVIIEASNTSGTLTQARACERLSRQLYISELCATSKDATWTDKHISRGAIVFSDADDLARKLECLL